MRPRAHGHRQPLGKGTIPGSGTKVTTCQAVFHGAFSSSIAFASILKSHKFGPAHPPLHPAWLGWGTCRLLAIGTPADPPVLSAQAPQGATKPLSSTG